VLADFNIAEVLTGAMPKPEPSSAEVFQQATALHRAGEFDKAEAVLRRAIGRDPDNSDLHNARGVMLAAMQKQLEALCCYRNAIACSPSAAGIWTNLGNSLTRSKHLKSAIWAHRRAIALAKTDDALLWHNLGVSLAEAGQHGEAVSAFTKSIEFDPGRLLTGTAVEAICTSAIIVRPGRTMKLAALPDNCQPGSSLARPGKDNPMQVGGWYW
jgi:Flp pilus assembly protein TadD